MDAYTYLRELIGDRYSCRKYFPRTPEKGDILAVLEGARMAPSACNRQPWRFVVVERDADPELHKAVAASYPRDWAGEAPVFIVACGRRDECWKRPTDGWSSLDVDLAIAVDHLTLAATSVGLATCWVCNFDPLKLREAINAPEDIEPVALLPLGYPDPSATVAPKNRKSLEDIVQWGSF